MVKRGLQNQYKGFGDFWSTLDILGGKAIEKGGDVMIAKQAAEVAVATTQIKAPQRPTDRLIPLPKEESKSTFLGMSTNTALIVGGVAILGVGALIYTLSKRK